MLLESISGDVHLSENCLEHIHRDTVTCLFVGSGLGNNNLEIVAESLKSQGLARSQLAQTGCRILQQIVDALVQFDRCREQEVGLALKPDAEQSVSILGKVVIHRVEHLIVDVVTQCVELGLDLVPVLTLV